MSGAMKQLLRRETHDRRRPFPQKSSIITTLCVEMTPARRTVYVPEQRYVATCYILLATGCPCYTEYNIIFCVALLQPLVTYEPFCLLNSDENSTILHSVQDVYTSVCGHFNFRLHDCLFWFEHYRLSVAAATAVIWREMESDIVYSPDALSFNGRSLHVAFSKVYFTNLFASL